MYKYFSLKLFTYHIYIHKINHFYHIYKINLFFIVVIFRISENSPFRTGSSVGLMNKHGFLVYFFNPLRI